MENAISTLTYFNTSKVGIKSFVDKVISEVEQGLINPLDLLIYIKSIEKSLEGITSGTKQMMINEADKYTEKTIEYKGASISKEELGVKYDYSKCGDIVFDELTRRISAMTDQRKQREAMLKTLKDSMTLVDEETGETWTVNPPIKTSTSGIKVIIK